MSQFAQSHAYVLGISHEHCKLSHGIQAAIYATWGRRCWWQFVLSHGTLLWCILHTRGWCSWSFHVNTLTCHTRHPCSNSYYVRTLFLVSHVGSLHHCTAPILWHILHGDTVLGVPCEHFKLSPGIHRRCFWRFLLVVCTITQCPPYDIYYMGTLFLVFQVSGLWCCMVSMLQFIQCGDTVLGLPCWQLAPSHSAHPTTHPTWGHCSWCSAWAACGAAWHPGCAASTSRCGRSSGNTAAPGRSKALAGWRTGYRWHPPGKGPLESVGSDTTSMHIRLQSLPEAAQLSLFSTFEHIICGYWIEQQRVLLVWHLRKDVYIELFTKWSVNRGNFTEKYTPLFWRIPMLVYKAVYKTVCQQRQCQWKI